MLTITSRRFGAMTLMACVVSCASTVSAQGIEVTPVGGYRFGGDFFELLTQQPIDLDGAPAIGLAVDVALTNDLQVEAFFTHQNAHISVPTSAGSSTRLQVSVDHWQAGGLREFDDGRIRPFLTGSLGLTRYAVEGDGEVRFTLAAGGGVKLFPARHVGARLDGRVFATLTDADARVFACSPGVCLVGFDADVVWQAEFTAGLVVRFH